MAGVKGRSGGKRRGAGRKPLSDDLHRLRGTWRPQRHGLPTIGATAIATVPVATVDTEAPRHLRPATAAWFASVLKGWVLEAHDRMMLQAAAEAWDQSQTAREILADGLTVPTADGGCKAHPLPATVAAARGQFAALIAQLDLDDAGTPRGGQ